MDKSNQTARFVLTERATLQSPISLAYAASASAMAAEPQAIRELIVGTSSSEDITSAGRLAIILGEGGADRISIHSSTTDALVFGGAGSDTISSQGYFLYAVGGAGADVLEASWMGRLWGGEATVSIDAPTVLSDNYSNLNARFDDLVDDQVRDELRGGRSSWDDVYVGRYDVASDAGGGADQAFLVFQAFSKGVTLDLSGDDALAVATKALDASVVGFEYFTFLGSPGPDIVTVGLDVSAVHGGAGNDVLTVDPDLDWGSDWMNLYGGAGSDILTGGTANDQLIANDDGFDGDQLFGGAGRDIGYVSDNDSFDGGEGDDLCSVSFEHRAEGVRLDLRRSVEQRLEQATGGTYLNVERFSVAGTNHGDVIRASSGLYVDGLGGDDILYGHAGADLLTGGWGDDILHTGGDEGGGDSLRGDAGDDTVVFTGKSTDYEIGEKVAVVNLVQVTLKSDPDVVHYLYSIERLQFSDTTIRIDREPEIPLLRLGTDGVDYLKGGYTPQSGLVVTLRGLGGDDFVLGSDGQEILDGGDGVDVLVGDGGDDVYIVDRLEDRVLEGASGGIDTIVAGFSYSLAGRPHVENLTLTGSKDIDGRGSDLNNVLIGNAGKNLLTGGKGDDTYHVQTQGDRVAEKANEGTDLVISSISWSLDGSQVENLTLTGSAALNGVGNALNNVITGNAGKNVLTGGRGDDTYIVQTLGDRVVERSGEGRDHVVSSIGFSLAGQYIENLTLTGTASINGSGNSLDNVLTGNAGVNVLSGGTGNDTYVVQTAGDRVVELNGQGVDRVLSSVSFSLAGQYVEHLTLTGSGAINGTGNSLANTLVGNAGKNVLAGAQGNDTYVVQTVGDRVLEKDGQGSDHVLSSVSFDLSGQFIEALTLTGSADINAAGNSLANTIAGNAGDNRIYGAGGQDRLSGGGGADTFIFRSTTDSTVALSDRITDLSRDDLIDLSAIDANTAAAGNQAFSLVDSFTNVAGQARLTFSDGVTMLDLDINGDGRSDFLLRIQGDHRDHDGWVL
ncbi:calcium-binding protein [Brevundimonas lutea]|uniref:calcium-binding protein n=1 Tax=Brevundimonas lutea TaxID=2293980 RepID=UPI000F03642D|nr:hypothetical protein [Brevundimonas lutea]